MSSPPAVSPDTLLSKRYRLLAPLGRGGTATVWRATDQHLGRPVAVKILQPELLADSASRARLHIEAQALAQLSDPHLAAVYDFDIAEQDDIPPLPYLVMELVEGVPLTTVPTPIPWRAAAALTAQVAQAVAAAHARGVVHRDITAGNVLITRSGIKVIDFGICALEGDQDWTADGIIVGTPAYLAPERILGRTVGPQVDVYAMGVLLYYAMTGQWPWPASSTEDFLIAHRTLDPHPLLVDGLPQKLAQLCLRCLSKEPALRPTAAELAEELRQTAASGADDVMLVELVAGAVADPGRIVTFAGAEEVKALRRHAGSSGSARNRRRVWRLAVAVGAVAVVAAGLTGLAPNGESAQPQAVGPAANAAGVVVAPSTCHVSYRPTRVAPDRFTAAVTVTNNGTVAVKPGWRWRFALPNTQRVDPSTAHAWRSDAASVTSAPFEDELPPGESTTLTLDGLDEAAEGDTPTLFYVNDLPCTATVITSDSTATTPIVQVALPVAASSGGGKNDKPGKQNGKGKPPGNWSDDGPVRNGNR